MSKVLDMVEGEGMRSPECCPVCGDIMEPDDVTGEVRCLTDHPAPFKVTAESLGHQAIGAFRTLAEAEVALPRNGSVSLATRMEIPWHLVVRRKVQDVLALKPTKKEREKEATR